MGLICLVPSLLSGPASAAGQENAIRLLSNETADACIQAPACMGDLLLQAAFGPDQAADQPSAPLFKWEAPVRITNLAGNQVTDAQTSVRGWLEQMSALATIAGGDLSETAGDDGEVVNFVLLISDDFIRDRDSAFGALLTDVFAGSTAAYDQLASGPSPVCRGELFVEKGTPIAGGLALAESDVGAEQFQGCVHRVVLNVLGLRHRLPDGADSVLNPDSERLEWTAIDFLLLRMLNDPAVSAGMTRDELAALVPEIHQRALRPSS